MPDDTDDFEDSSSATASTTPTDPVAEDDRRGSAELPLRAGAHHRRRAGGRHRPRGDRPGRRRAPRAAALERRADRTGAGRPRHAATARSSRSPRRCGARRRPTGRPRKRSSSPPCSPTTCPPWARSSVSRARTIDVERQPWHFESDDTLVIPPEPGYEPLPEPEPLDAGPRAATPGPEPVVVLEPEPTRRRAPTSIEPRRASAGAPRAGQRPPPRPPRRRA